MWKTLTLTQPFSLEYTLRSGQFFSWIPENGWYIVKTGQRIFRLKQNNKSLYFSAIYGEVSTEFLRDYFRLEDDMDKIFATWANDRLLNSVYSQYSGLRLIRQDPWECMLGFVLSIASNIPRIKQNLRTLSQLYGKTVESPHMKFYLLPEPGDLLDVTLEELYDTGIGFRARFLREIIPVLHSDFNLEALRHLSYHPAKNELMTLHGIGEKVADCILLFSLDQLEAFPTDTWIVKVLKQNYFPDASPLPAKLAGLAREKFGAYGGYAQQYLYHYARNHLK